MWWVCPHQMSRSADRNANAYNKSFKTLNQAPTYYLILKKRSKSWMMRRYEMHRRTWCNSRDRLINDHFNKFNLDNSLNYFSQPILSEKLTNLCVILHEITRIIGINCKRDFTILKLSEIWFREVLKVVFVPIGKCIWYLSQTWQLKTSIQL